MLRHTNSFLLSLFFHLMLAFTFFTVYKYVQTSEKKSSQNIKIELTQIQISQPEPKPKPEPTKKEIIKPQPKIEPKPEPKLKPEPKPKPEPIKKEIIKPQPKIEPKIQPEKLTKAQPFESNKQNTLQTTSKMIAPKVMQKTSEEIANTYLNEHLAIIRKLLVENLYYPRSARFRKITGRVIVKFTLTQSGLLQNAQVVSSPNEILSRAAIQTIQDIYEKFPLPKSNLTLHVPIDYTLR